MHRRLFILVVLLGMVAVSPWLSPARAQPIDKGKVAKIQSAYVLNFIRFTRWPNDRYEGEDTPMVIGLIGDDSLGATLDKTIAGEKIDGRPIEVVRLRSVATWSESGPHLNDKHGRSIENLRRCHVLYIDKSEKEYVDLILGWVDRADVLTISDLPGFAQRGGMLGLVIRDRRVVFDANPQAIARTRIKVSSKILNLAQLVETTQGRAP